MPSILNLNSWILMFLALNLNIEDLILVFLNLNLYLRILF